MDEIKYVWKQTALLDEAFRLGKEHGPSEEAPYLCEYIMLGLLEVCNIDLENYPDPLSSALRDEEEIEDAIEEQKDLRVRFGEAGYGLVKRQYAINQILEILKLRPKDGTQEKWGIWQEKAADVAASNHGQVTASQYLDIILAEPTRIICWNLQNFFVKKDFLVPEPEEIAPDEKRKELADSAMRLYYLEEELMNDIMGQEEAVDAFVRGLSSILFFPSDPRENGGPDGIFLLAGPPGVGKTMLATKMAKSLGYESLILDMSGYACGRDAVNTLTGFDSTFAASHEGTLTGFVNENPKSIVVFDEIEKASGEVILELLPMLDRGRVTDRFHHREISFTQTICIFTTNAGRTLYDEGRAEAGEISREVILEALQTERKPGSLDPFFPPEICSRLAKGTLIMFRHLSAGNLTDIAGKAMRERADLFYESRGIEVTLDPQIPGILLLCGGGENDARKFQKEAELFVEGEIYKFTTFIEPQNMEDRLERVKKISLIVDEDPLSVSESEEEDEKTEKSRILIYVPNIPREPADVAENLDILRNEDFVEVVDRLESKYDLDYVHSYPETARMIEKWDYIFALCLAPVRAITAEERDDPALHTDKPPLGANRLQEFRKEFLQLLTEECPDLPVYVFYTAGGSRAFETEVGFLRAGATKIIPIYKKEDSNGYDFEAALAPFDEKEAEIKLERKAVSYARQRKALRFATKPKMQGDELLIQLHDFMEIRNVSGSDRDAILFDDKIPSVSFDNVIGADTAKSELEGFVEYLKNPEQYCDRGFTPPKGVLLYGPPGTGKTYLAEALAHEADVAFFPVNGGDLVAKGILGTEDLFSRARRYAPSIVFIDEIDAVGKERMGISPSESVLNKLLSEMDGFDTDRRKPIFVMAATNFPLEREYAGQVVLDEALTRRFDRRIEVGLPDTKDREVFISRQLESFQHVVSDSTLKNIAKRSVGLNFPRLANIVQLAARKAYSKAGERADDYCIDDECLQDAFEEDLYGPERRNSDEEDREEEYLRMVARHEAGHACLGCMIGEPPSFATIVSRGAHGGYVMPDPDQRKPSPTRQDLLNEIMVDLGGRAAEQVYYGREGGLTTGAVMDLRHATQKALSLVLLYGMDQKTGVGSFPDQEISERTRQRANKILEEQLKRARKILNKEKPKMDVMVEELMEKNQLNADEIIAIMEGE